VLGAIRDLTGGFTAVLWTLVAVAALLVVVDASVSPARLARRRLAAQGST
jgi:cyanate permease